MNASRLLLVVAKQAVTLSIVLAFAAGCGGSGGSGGGRPATLTGEGFEIEPNDSPDEAQEIGVGATITGDISGDDPGYQRPFDLRRLADWYRIDVTEASGVVLRFDSGPGGFPEVMVLDGTLARSMVTSVESRVDLDTGKRDSILTAPLQPGTYYVAVQTSGNDRAGYTIGVEGHGEIEPNDSPSDAQGIGLGESIRGGISAGDNSDWRLTPAGLADWYVFEVEEATDVSIKLEFLSRHDVEVYILKSTVFRSVPTRSRDQDPETGKTTSILFASLDPGSYFVGVQRPVSAVLAPYTLQIDED